MCTFLHCEKPLREAAEEGARVQASGPALQAQNATIWSTLVKPRSQQTTVFPGAAVILGFWKKTGNLKALCGEGHAEEGKVAS